MMPLAQIDNVSSDQVTVHRFDGEPPSRGLLKAVTLASLPTDNAGTTKSARNDLATERELDWIRATMKEALSMLSVCLMTAS